MKINWFSNSMWASTGYGVQTKLFVPRMRDAGHKMSVTSFYGLQGGMMTVDGIDNYPVVREMYGQDVIGAHAKHAQADCVISLVDIWVMQPQHIPLPWFPWFPIDYEPMPANVRETARMCTKGITMSKFGQKMAENVGINTFYVPHGVDTKVYKPVDQREARLKLGFPEDAFIVGMVAANKNNPPRKAFFEQIAAFAALKKVHSDAVLYLHTDDGTRGGEGVNLVDYCQTLGLVGGKDFIFCDQYINALGFPDPYMQAIYSAMDVLMNVSLGEGFGVPIIEAQACGTPVIVGDWTSMSELCMSGWKVGKKQAEPVWSSFFHAFQYQPHTDAIAELLLKAYEVRGNQDYRERARAGAMQYDADKVFEKYWKPTLADIEERIKNSTSKMELVTF